MLFSDQLIVLTNGLSHSPLQGFLIQFCMHLSSLPWVLHASPFFIFLDLMALVTVNLITNWHVTRRRFYVHSPTSVNTAEISANLRDLRQPWWSDHGDDSCCLLVWSRTAHPSYCSTCLFAGSQEADVEILGKLLRELPSFVWSVLPPLQGCWTARSSLRTLLSLSCWGTEAKCLVRGNVSVQTGKGECTFYQWLPTWTWNYITNFGIRTVSCGRADRQTTQHKIMYKCLQ